jgi:hypothetical protein
MGRIIKALILGWISKKIYDRTLGSESGEEATPASAKRSAPAHARKSPAKRSAHKPAKRAA